MSTLIKIKLPDSSIKRLLPAQQYMIFTGLIGKGLQKAALLLSLAEFLLILLRL
jgi:hypothetical protein